MARRGAAPGEADGHVDSNSKKTLGFQHHEGLHVGARPDRVDRLGQTGTSDLRVVLRFDRSVVA